MRRRLWLISAALAAPLVFALLLAAQAFAQDATVLYHSKEDLDGKRIGVQTGTTYDEIVMQSLPHAEIS